MPYRTTSIPLSAQLSMNCTALIWQMRMQIVSKSNVGSPVQNWSQTVDLITSLSAAVLVLWLPTLSFAVSLPIWVFDSLNTELSFDDATSISTYTLAHYFHVCILLFNCSVIELHRWHIKFLYQVGPEPLLGKSPYGGIVFAPRNNTFIWYEERKKHWYSNRPTVLTKPCFEQLARTFIKLMPSTKICILLWQKMWTIEKRILLSVYTHLTRHGTYAMVTVPYEKVILY